MSSQVCEKLKPLVQLQVPQIDGFLVSEVAYTVIYVVNFKSKQAHQSML